MLKIHQRLISQSRDRNFLLRSSIIIGIISILIGIVLPSISTKENRIIEKLEIACPWIKKESIPLILNRLDPKQVKRIIDYRNGNVFDEVSIARMAREGLYLTASILEIPQGHLPGG